MISILITLVKSAGFGIVLIIAMITSKVIGCGNDFLFIVSIIAFFWFVKKDAMVLSIIFGILGVGLEYHRTMIGSWSYDIENMFFVLNKLPLFVFFLYVAIMNFLLNIDKNLGGKIIKIPNLLLLIFVTIVVYINFLIFIIDRNILSIIVFLILIFTSYQFKNNKKIQLLFPIIVIVMSLYLVENISTYLKIWTYKNQSSVWHIVSPYIIESWFLFLFLAVSLIMVKKKIS